MVFMFWFSAKFDILINDCWFVLVIMHWFWSVEDGEITISASNDSSFLLTVLTATAFRFISASTDSHERWWMLCTINHGVYLSGGDVAQLAEVGPEHHLGVSIPSVARDFSLRVNFKCRLSDGVCTLPCAIACINIYVHVKDPVVQIRVQWVMETLKHPACT